MDFSKTRSSSRIVLAAIPGWSTVDQFMPVVEELVDCGRTITLLVPNPWALTRISKTDGHLLRLLDLGVETVVFDGIRMTWFASAAEARRACQRFLIGRKVGIRSSVRGEPFCFGPDERLVVLMDMVSADPSLSELTRVLFPERSETRIVSMYHGTVEIGDLAVTPVTREWMSKSKQVSFVAFGNQGKSTLLRLGIPSDAVVACGIPRHDPQYLDEVSGAGSKGLAAVALGPEDVVILTRSLAGGLLQDLKMQTLFLVEIRGALQGGRRLHVRCHPDQNRALFVCAWIASTRSLRNFSFRFLDAPISLVRAANSIFITPFSGTVADVVAAGGVSVEVRPDGIAGCLDPSFDTVRLLGLARRVSRGDELATLIDDEHFATLRSQQITSYQAYFYDPRGAILAVRSAIAEMEGFADSPSG